MANMTPEDIAILETARSSEEWKQCVTTVKQRHGGKYPDDWWEVMKLSGRMDAIFAHWGGSTKLSFSVIDPTTGEQTVVAEG